jgi:hypothetical protein
MCFSSQIVSNLKLAQSISVANLDITFELNQFPVPLCFEKFYRPKGSNRLSTKAYREAFAEVNSKGGGGPMVGIQFQKEK